MREFAESLGQLVGFAWVLFLAVTVAAFVTWAAVQAWQLIL